MQIFTIAANTFTEAIRQPVYLIILGCSLCLILLSPYFTMFVMLENNKMVKDMGLSTILVTGLLLSAFSASSVIYKEIENKTILTVISKPVSRFSFILGKYLGLSGGLLVAQYLLTLVFIHVTRTEITEAAYSDTDYPVVVGYIAATVFTIAMGIFANFFYERSFTSSTVFLALPVYTLIFLVLCIIDNKWALKPFTMDIQLVFAALFIFMATAVFTALATAASTRLGPISTLVICTSVFFSGLLSDYFLARHKETYLFSLENYRAGVNLENLRKEFDKRKLALSEAGVVEVIEEGNQWRVRDLKKRYLVIAEGKQGNVYEEETIYLFGYKVIPNFQIYWVADAVASNRPIPLDYFYRIVLYTFLLLIAVLSLAMALFEEKETQ